MAPGQGPQTAGHVGALRPGDEELQGVRDRAFHILCALGGVSVVTIIVAVTGLNQHWVPPFLVGHHGHLVPGSQAAARDAALTLARAHSFWNALSSLALLLLASGGSVLIFWVWREARRVGGRTHGGTLAVIVGQVGMGLVIAGILPVGLWLNETFGFISTEANGLLAIFTFVYVVATMMMVWQNERARRTQLEIATMQARTQEAQDKARDRTAQQTAEALAQIAESLATLTALLNSQKNTLPLGNVPGRGDASHEATPANGHRSPTQNTPALHVGRWTITRR